MRDVITYPLMHELFAFRKRYVEAEVNQQNFGVDFHSKQVWKRYCKKHLDNYNAIPSLNIWLPFKFWSAACFWKSFEGQLALIFFLALPGSLQRDQVREVVGRD